MHVNGCSDLVWFTAEGWRNQFMSFSFPLTLCGLSASFMMFDNLSFNDVQFGHENTFMISELCFRVCVYF